MFSRLLTAAVLGGLALLPANATADVTPEQYEHTLHLREKWLNLTRDVADPARWMRDGSAFYYRKSVAGGFRFVTVSVPALTRSDSIDQEKIAAALSRATGRHYGPLQLPFAAFDFDTDGAAITFRFDDKAWRCTLTEYRCALDAPHIQPKVLGVTRDLLLPLDNHPRISPDGTREAFTADYNLVVRERLTGETQTLTFDGTAGNFYDPQTISWSPDSARIAIYRVQPGMRHEAWWLDAVPADRHEAKLVTRLYPRAGDVIDRDQPVLIDLAKRAVIRIDDRLFPNAFDTTPLRWSRDGKTVSFSYIERGYQSAGVIAVDAQSGRVRAPVTEHADTVVDAGRIYVHDVGGNANEFIWASERDGWRHLYLFDGHSGRVKRQITRGEWVVRDIVGVDDERRIIWFSASGVHAGEDPYLRHLFRVSFDGGGLRELTPEAGDHEIALSPDKRLFVDTHSRIDVPTVAELRSALDGARVATLERGDISRLTAAGWRAPEAFCAKGRDGKTDIWGMIVRPIDFDPAKKYPVIEQIYAGPHRIAVPKTFWPFGVNWGGDREIGLQELANLGFVVVMIDGMGTPFRSRAFHDVAWRNINDAGLPDRIAWHRAAAAKYPWYDITRVGIYGVSAGGKNTLAALTRYPDFYKVGIAFNGNYDDRVHSLDWTEQWMGLPLDESYRRSAAAEHVANLKGALLLISGRLDMNVHPANTDRLIQALIDAGKYFDLLVLPEGDHSDGHYTGPIDYVLRKQYDFFLSHLAGEQTPAWNAMPIDQPRTPAASADSGAAGTRSGS